MWVTGDGEDLVLVGEDAFDLVVGLASVDVLLIHLFKIIMVVI